MHGLGDWPWRPVTGLATDTHQQNNEESIQEGVGEGVERKADSETHAGQIWAEIPTEMNV